MGNTNYLEFKGISKAFVGVQALDNISFRAEGGEICALLGENGAGKSTLLKILSGAQSADKGQYFINGEEVSFKTPIEAIKAGVNVIYQERQLVGELTVTENVFMEDLYKNKAGIVDFRKSHEEMQKLIDAFNMPFKPQTKVNRLSVAHQQMVEIMKAYRRESKIIAFDEPTAALSDAEIKVLFDLIRKMRDEGKVVLYVSHRLKELFELSDKVVILKDGCFVDEIRTENATENELVSKMVGRNIGDAYSMLDRNNKIGDVVLEARNLRSDYVHDVSFSLHKGEVLGFAGLVGAGRTETMRLIFGADKTSGGEIYVEGKKKNIRSPKDAIAAGIGLCPEDRKEQGLVLGRSISDNLVLPILKTIANGGVINNKKEKELAQSAIDKYRIKTHSAAKIAGELSGGNQQKAILGRWMLANLKILILDEPTKGIDVGAKAEIYQMVCDLAKAGMGVIFISSELPEVLNVCDRVVVMNEGHVMGELGENELSEELVMRLAMRDADCYA
ncbi:MAG: sugar ABC transporter ATP-binding protein [Clostridiales bacterium]|nr:sugar ABC transporter ATP-binding protein [Clostridiales bacterium]